MNFLSRHARYASEKPYTLRFTPSISFPRTNIETDHRAGLVIEDIRGKEKDFTLDRNGFMMMPFASALPYEDFQDKTKVVDVYLREVLEKTCNLLKAEKVILLEHIV